MIYGHKNKLSCVLAGICDDSYHSSTLSHKGIDVLIRDIDGVQVVAFAGTNPLKDFSIDILRDLWITRYSYCGLKGHVGVIRGAKDVKNLIMDRLSIDKPVHLTGHSLGGGLALVMTRLLDIKGYDIHGLTTFGALRVISKGFHHFEHINVMQCESGDDIVPTLQFWTSRKHINRINIGNKRSKNWFRHRNWHDHMMDNYKVDIYSYCYL